MKKAIRRITLFLLIGYLGMGLLLYTSQRGMIYFPTPHIPTPHSTMTLENQGEKIHVIVLNPDQENAILYFGGNAESMARGSYEIAQKFPAFTIYLMDYRGYGRSSGTPTEKGLYSDALKLYDTVAVKHKNISIGGRSLGSSVATYVAAHREVSKLVLITPFDSIVNVAKGMYPLFPVSLLLQDTYNSAQRVKDIKAKTFIVIAEDDRVINIEHTNNLIDAFEGKELKVKTIKNRGHNDISFDPAYYRSIQNFLSMD